MSRIEAVMFDAGGVLHENNTANTDDLTREFGVSGDVMAQIWAKEMPLLGSGKIDEAEFWRRVHEKHGIREVDVRENLLGRAFVEQLVPFPDVKEIVKELGGIGIKTAVLSDTIEPHARALSEAGIYDGFDALFLSHEVGLRKPSREIYEYTLEHLNVSPNSAIFIDDNPINAQVASDIGMHGITFVNTEQLRADLKKLIPEL